MQVVEGLYHAAGVETCRGVVKVAPVSVYMLLVALHMFVFLSPQYSPQLATEARIHQHVKIFAIFECFIEFDYEVTVGFFHYLFLCNLFRIFIMFATSFVSTTVQIFVKIII